MAKTPEYLLDVGIYDFRVNYIAVLFTCTTAKLFIWLHFDVVHKYSYPGWGVAPQLESPLKSISCDYIRRNFLRKTAVDQIQVLGILFRARIRAKYLKLNTSSFAQWISPFSISIFQQLNIAKNVCQKKWCTKVIKEV